MKPRYIVHEYPAPNNGIVWMEENMPRPQIGEEILLYAQAEFD